MACIDAGRWSSQSVYVSGRDVAHSTANGTVTITVISIAVEGWER